MRQKPSLEKYGCLDPKRLNGKSCRSERNVILTADEPPQPMAFFNSANSLSLASSSRATLGLIMPVCKTEFGRTCSQISSVEAAALVAMSIVADHSSHLTFASGN